MNISTLITYLHSLLNALSGLMQAGALPHLGDWDYVLLVLLSILQGPVASLLAGTAAAAGLVQVGWVFLAICTGNLVTDLLWYAIGRLGKIDWLFRTKRLFNVPRKRVEQIRSIITDRSSTIMTLAKISTGFVLPTMIATGLAQVPWKRWLPSLMAVELLRTGTLTLVGFYSAQALSQILKGFSYLTILATIVFVGVSGWFIYRTLHLEEKIEKKGLGD